MVYPSDCCYLPYSIHFSELMLILFTSERTKHENTCRPPFLYNTKMAADGYQARKALMLREFRHNLPLSGVVAEKGQDMEILCLPYENGHRRLLGVQSRPKCWPRWKTYNYPSLPSKNQQGCVPSWTMSTKDCGKLRNGHWTCFSNIQCTKALWNVKQL